MSAPDTTLAKQKRRHWGPLLGMALAIIVIALLLVWVLGGDNPEGTTTDVAPDDSAGASATDPAQEPGAAPADGSAAPDGDTPSE